MREEEPPAAPGQAMPPEPQTSVHDQTIPPVSGDDPAGDRASETPGDDAEP